MAVYTLQNASEGVVALWMLERVEDNGDGGTLAVVHMWLCVTHNI